MVTASDNEVSHLVRARWRDDNSVFLSWVFITLRCPALFANRDCVIVDQADVCNIT